MIEFSKKLLSFYIDSLLLILLYKLSLLLLLSNILRVTSRRYVRVLSLNLFLKDNIIIRDSISIKYKIRN